MRSERQDVDGLAEKVTGVPPVAGCPGQRENGAPASVRAGAQLLYVDYRVREHQSGVR